MLGNSGIVLRVLLAVVPCALLGFGAGYALGGDGNATGTTFKAQKLEASASRPAIDVPNTPSRLPALIRPPAVDNGGGTTPDKSVDNTGGGSPPPPPVPPPPPPTGGEEF